MIRPTRIVHTADWHLGARLVDHERTAEHALFLDWLLVQMQELKPDLLIVAGDIFDNTTPSQEALALYYGFLARLAATVSCQVLILGGNHDSPATLQAPRELLSALRITVHGCVGRECPPVIVELPELVVCAVPYLRERDVRRALAGQSHDEVAELIRGGILAHYREVLAAARALAAGRPIVGTGHLTAIGRESSPSERDIHVGNLGAVPAACFEGFAYTALGHIHRPQMVGGDERVRYAGSPIALSFPEADLVKEIRVVDIRGGHVEQSAVTIPIFRSLVRIAATVETMGPLLLACSEAAGTLEPWVELTLADAHQHPELPRMIDGCISGLRLRVLKRVLARDPAADGLGVEVFAGRTLAELDPAEVFEERLRSSEIDPQSPDGLELVATFAELITGMLEEEPAR